MNSPNTQSATPPAREVFATTRWTLVIAAGNRNTVQANLALEELCRLYWYPLYAYTRRRGHSPEDAEDLVQGFFARFLERNYLDNLNSERGKFRAFLLAALKHYLSNERDRANRLKRGGGQALLSLDWQEADNRYRVEPLDELSPDKLFDRAWAVLLLERAMCRLREEFALEGRPELFEGLKPFLTMDKEAVSYDEVVANLRLTKEAARVAVHRLRKRYRQLMREEIRQTISDPAQAQEELRALFAAFAN